MKKNNEFEFNAVQFILSPGRMISLCVKFQLWFFIEKTLQTSTGSKTTWETLEKVWNIFKVNNKDVNNVVLVFLLLTLKIFYIFLQYFNSFEQENVSPAGIYCLKLTIETLKQGVKYV